MKFSKKLKFTIFFICIAVLLLVSTIAYADNDTLETELNEDGMVTATDENISQSTSKQVTKDLYLMDNSVTVDYPVLGNVFILSNNVTIDSQITGNVFILAQNVNIKTKAYINSSLFVCAENVTIDGYVFDLYSAAKQLTVSSTGRILRDVTATGDSCDLSGVVSRNANLNFESVAVNAYINGNLSYSSKTDSVSRNFVKGDVSFEEMSTSTKSDEVSDFLSDLLKTLVMSAIVILIVVLALPKFAEKEQQVLENKAMPALGYGAIALIAIPVACFILFFTVLGIMPALSILFAYLFLILELSTPLVAIPLARIICNKINKSTNGMYIFISIVLVIAISLLAKIPVIGTIISILVTLFGIGILTYLVFHSKIEPKVKKEKENK